MNTELYKYISKQTNDPIIEWRQCSWTDKEFAIFQSDIDFLEKMKLKIGTEKIAIPLPNLCPEARHMRRLMVKNERFLHQDICELSEEKTISRFVDKHVYSNKSWHDRDSWQQVFLDYDPSRSFQQHFGWLVENSICQDLIGSSKNILNNARYVNHASKQSNTYLLSNARDDEYSAYGLFVNYCSWVFDCSYISHSEHCYECVSCTKLYKCFFCYDVSSSSDLYFCSDMLGCSHCLFCSGLEHQSYCIRNKQYSKEQYQKRLKETDIGSFEKLCEYRQEYAKIVSSHPRSSMNNVGSENVIGDGCSFSSQCSFCFSLQSCQDCRYCSVCFESQDMMDVSSFGESSHHLYECSQSGKNSSYLYFCTMVAESHYLLYCLECKHCRYCFGCVNLYKKEYCIFNKQYKKEEYEKLVIALIKELQESGQRGEFLAPQFSPFPYNNTPALDEFPPQYVIDSSGQKNLYHENGYGSIRLSSSSQISDATLFLGGKEEIQIQWMNDEQKRQETQKKLTLPDHIDEVDERVLQGVVFDESHRKGFRVLKMELSFYKRHRLAIPRIHPEKRIEVRNNLIAAKNMYLRYCDRSGEQILSVYSENAGFDVYGEYLK